MQPTIDRDPRVRFKHPVRVVPIGGPPRAYRVLSSNLSKEGMFLRMPTPFDAGTKVALSLEAGGRVLPFAQAEVVWRDLDETKAAGRGAGFGVRFTGFLHPRAHELVDYLVDNLETGKPLSPPAPATAWRKRLQWVALGLGAVVVGAVLTTGVLRLFRSEPVAVAAVEEVPLPAAVEEIAAAQVEAAPVVEVKEEAPAPIVIVEAAPAAEPEPIAEAIAPPAPAPIAARLEDIEEAAPVAAPMKVEAPAKASAKALAIPSGAVRAITASVDGELLSLALTLAPGAAITNAFTLGNPDRLAIDVRGPSPKKSHVVSGFGVVQKVRIGKLPRGTRVVIDLSLAPGKPVVVTGNSVSVPVR